MEKEGEGKRKRKEREKKRKNEKTSRPTTDGEIQRRHHPSRGSG